MPLDASLNRRSFLTGAGAALFAAASDTSRSESLDLRAYGRIPLGMDNFSLRGMGWKAPQFIEYAASMKLDTLFITDLDTYESHETAYLKKIREQAENAGIKIHTGGMSICPTSKGFNTRFGNAEEYLKLLIRVAHDVGSPVARCVLGGGGDRADGGIERHIESTVKTCKAARSYAIDHNVKIAIENHAGDMQAWELVGLVEAAGKDYVGVNIDSGNALWTLEDPMESLETLGPYAVTSSLRDGAVWEVEKGAMVAWTAFGHGQIDYKAYAKRFGELCPGIPFQIETITGGPRFFNYLEKDFWKVYPKARAESFARFVALAKRGKPVEPPPKMDKEAEKLFQKSELEKSINYCRDVLGLGVRKA